MMFNRHFNKVIFRHLSDLLEVKPHIERHTICFQKGMLYIYMTHYAVVIYKDGQRHVIDIKQYTPGQIIRIIDSIIDSVE